MSQREALKADGAAAHIRRFASLSYYRLLS